MVAVRKRSVVPSDVELLVRAAAQSALATHKNLELRCALRTRFSVSDDDPDWRKDVLLVQVLQNGEVLGVPQALDLKKKKGLWQPCKSVTKQYRSGGGQEFSVTITTKIEDFDYRIVIDVFFSTTKNSEQRSFSIKQRSFI